MALEFVDAHHHLWDLGAVHYPWLMARGERRFFGDPTPIQRNYLPSDLLNESRAYRPSASVHIQVGAAPEDSLRETAWLHTLAELPQAVVAFCDLAAPDVSQQLEAQMRYPRVRGIRQIVGRHVDEDGRHGTATLLADPAWLNGLKALAGAGLSFDLQMIPSQMPALMSVFEQVTELPVALCHAGSPWDQSPAGLKSWREGLEQFARLPNSVCKLSGLGMFRPDWQVDDWRPIVDAVLDIFGASRVMVGSNFPVDKLYRDYAAVWSAYETLTAGVSADERLQLFSGCARRFYRF
ncbi:MAG: amidohydrolase family protein [Pseudomonadota bacterium]